MHFSMNYCPLNYLYSKFLCFYYLTDFLQTFTNGQHWCLVVCKGEIIQVNAFSMNYCPWNYLYSKFLCGQLFLHCSTDCLQTLTNDQHWCLVVHKGEIIHVYAFLYKLLPFELLTLLILVQTASSLFSNWFLLNSFRWSTLVTTCVSRGVIHVDAFLMNYCPWIHLHSKFLCWQLFLSYLTDFLQTLTDNQHWCLVVFK